jgi:hypothetical protein
VTIENYEATKTLVREAKREGRIPSELTAAEVVAWAYGNAAIENEKVTREMTEEAVARLMPAKVG